jgi:hypothetical protein
MKSTFQKYSFVFFTFVFLVFSVAGFAQKQYKLSLIGFYNLENFYDTINQPNVKDEEYTPDGANHYTAEVYEDKVKRLTDVVSIIGKDVSPDGLALFGVAEIENATVLQDLVNEPRLRERNYKIVQYDSPDERGVDVGLIYNPKYFKVINSRPLRVTLPPDKYAYTAKELLDRDSICHTQKYDYACETQDYVDYLKALPPKTKINRMVSHKTRDVLWVYGELDGEPVHVFVNHWPSRRGGEEASAPGRAIAAGVSKHIIDSLAETDPNVKAIVMGDLNDDPVSPSITKVMQAKGEKEDVKAGGIYNPFTKFYKQGLGSMAYNDAWSLFDQIMISYGFLDQKQKGFFYQKAAVFNRDFMIQKTGRYKGYPLRTYDGGVYNHGYSDHFPTYIVLLKEKQ